MSIAIRDKICKDSLSVLEKNRISKPDKYIINLFDKEFIQYSTVFPSDLFRDVEVFTPHVVMHLGSKFLEIGIGNGITSVMAALQGKQVMGVDINPDAVNNAKENSKFHNVKKECHFLESNHFENLENEVFDTIYWNVPFCDQYEAHDSLEKSILDYKYLHFSAFIDEVKNHLNKDGSLIIGYSNIIGNHCSFWGMLNKLNYKTKNTLIQEFVEWNDHVFDLTLYQLKF